MRGTMLRSLQIFSFNFFRLFLSFATDLLTAAPDDSAPSGELKLLKPMQASLIPQLHNFFMNSLAQKQSVRDEEWKLWNIV
jgi:hypothetical protein